MSLGSSTSSTDSNASNSRQAKIRFVTVCFENAVIIERLLKSLETYCRVPFEVICWDNSPKPLNELKNLQSRFSFLKIEGGIGNIGFTRAVNRATEKLYGDDSWNELILINPDAYLASPITDEILLQLKSLNGICGFKVFSDAHKKNRQESARSFPSLLTSISGREGLLTRLFPSNPLSAKYLRRDLTESQEAVRVDWVSGCALYVSRDTWKRLEGFDERYFLYVDDVDLGRKANSLQIPVYYTPWIEVIHESRSTSGKNPWRSDYYHHMGMMLYSWKWSSPLGKVIFPILALGIWLRFIFRRILGNAGRTST